VHQVGPFLSKELLRALPDFACCFLTGLADDDESLRSRGLQLSTTSNCCDFERGFPLLKSGGHRTSTVPGNADSTACRVRMAI